MLKRRLVKALTLLIPVGLVLLGIVLLFASFLPFEVVHAWIAPYVFRSDSSLLTETYFQSIVAKLRIAGAVLLFAGGLLYYFRNPVNRYLSETMAAFPGFTGEIRGHISDFVRKENRVHFFAFLFVVVLAIALRMAFLFQPMRNDEAFTFLRYASQPLLIVVSKYSTPNNHIFHTLLVHLSYLLLGGSPWVIRLPALIAGVLLVPASYVFVRIFYRKHAALLAAALVASSSAIIEYSTNARGYTLVCLFFILILALAIYLKDNNNPAGWLTFSILSALGFYTIPVMLYPFGAVVLWFVLSVLFKDSQEPRIRHWRSLVISLLIIAVLTVVLYLPVLVTYGVGAIVGNQYVATQTWMTFFEGVPLSISEVWGQWNRDTTVIGSAILLVGFAVSLVFHRRLASYLVPPVVAVIIWCVAVVLLQRVVPYARVWLFLLPLYLGMASAGIVWGYREIGLRIGRSWTDHQTAALSVASVLVSSLIGYSVLSSQSVYYSNDTGTLRDADEIAVFLKGYLQPNDAVLAPVPSESPLSYYFARHNVSTEYLYANLSRKERLIVVVNEPDQTLEGILSSAGVETTSEHKARLIRKYRFATLYEVDLH